MNILDPNPSPSDLTELFESLGYRTTWDFSKCDGLHWHEFIDPNSDKMVLQVEFGISKDKFLEEWFDDTKEYPSFFIGGDVESKGFKKLKQKIDNLNQITTL